MLKVLLALIFVVILVVPSATWWVAQRPVPVLDGVGEVQGLQKPVMIRYDARAIPYIKADSDEDLYAAQGYAVARERMFQMDMLRRAAEGRTAQVFGITALPSDRLMRTIGFERLAKDELSHLSLQAKLALESYCRGVNSYLAENSDKLPAEFTLLGYKPEPWREVDTLALMKYLAYELDESWKLDELRWRVTNKVGDNLAQRLFKDDYAVSSWSPELKLRPGTAASTTPSQNKQSSSNISGTKKLGALIPPLTSFGLLSREASVNGTYNSSTTEKPPGWRRSAHFADSGVLLRNDAKISGFSNSELSRKLSALAAATPSLRTPQPGWGSTAFVLAPAYSKSGSPMLASDKHSALSTPCEYFLCGLSSTNIHVVGAALPGVPGIIFGRNNQCAWSGAGMHADVQDLFVEHFASEQDTKYKALDKVESAKEFREAIPVRFGNDVDHKITITRHGPILLRDKESAIALSWTGYETKKPWLNTITALNRCNDWGAFSQALSTYGGPPQLFVYADKRGNIGCHAAGIIPVRAGDGQGTTMSEGWLSRGEWVSTVDFDELPQSFLQAGSTGRAQGDFCIAAGQKLYASPAGSGRSAQLWGHQWDAPYRANRLALSLPRNKGQKLDLLDFSAYQGDELNMLASLVVSELKSSLDANKSVDAGQRKAMELMQRWDNCMKRDSAAASCYQSFVGTLARRILEPKLDRELCNEYFQRWPLWITFVEDYLRNKPKDLLPPGERTHDTFMLTTFAKSNTRLQLLFKSDKVEDWVWGKAHLANFKAVGLKSVAWLRNLMDIRDVGVGGDADCLNACDVDRLSVGGPLQSLNGPTVRLLIDMADNEEFYGNLALGQSGHYFSAFRQDQLKSWQKADPLPIAFSEAQMEKQSRQKFYLSSPGYR